MKLKMNSIFRSSLCLFRSSVVKPSDSGSALILVLLITALLTTIAVSFLSTSRVEQIAAKNFSRQNAATGLAELATQQAMAQIQQGFTINGTATTVITTQPGAITQFVFSNGNIISPTPVTSGGNITYPPTVKLFSTNGTINANLNNLQNPTSNSSATTNQFTITGNVSERINVPLENITSNGTLVGRIAYYVDDEGTKLNVNAATDDRNTLNISSSKSLSLSATTTGNLSTANLTTFRNFAAGSLTSNSSNILNWNHFFRHEQFLSHTYNSVANATLSKNATGLNDSQTRELREAFYKATTATPISDYHLKKTPWGTPRLFINDLPTDTANATASVNDIYNALSSPQLRDIYGATFADKYTDLGLKQIAANILQMRDPNTNTVNASFTSTVPRIGANASETVLLTSNSTKRIPAEYFGKAPYAYINEIGAMVAWGTYGDLVCFQLAPFITILNPELQTIPKSEVDLWQIEAMIDSFTVDITYKNSLGNTVGPITYGPTGFKKNDPWGHNSSEIYASRNKRNAALGGTTSIYETEINATVNNGDYIARSDGTFKWQPNGSIPAWSKELKSGEELQVCPYHYPWAFGWQGLQVNMPANDVIEIIDISNVKVKFEYITLSSVSGNTSLLRDFVLGSETGDINCWWLPQNGHPWNRSPPNLQYQKTRPFSSHPIWHPGHMISPDFSLKRIDGRIGFTANMTTNATANMTAQTSYMRTWSANGTQSWPTKNAASAFFTNNAVTTNTDAYPSNTSGHPIPGDPVPTQSSPFYDYPAPLASTLQFIGANLTTANSSVFTSPQELGKVHTNVQHRKLRFTPQHPNEVSTGSGGAGNQTFIPDWAMLDVISFGSNVTSVPAPAPVNLNGRFHVPSGSPQPAARMAAVESALKALDSATSVGNPFNSSNNSTTDRTQYMGGGNVSATIAGNIGNLTWSTGNFTAGNATWGKGNATNDDPGGTNSRRKTAKFPANQIVLPAEVTEIQSMADVVPMDSYTSNATIKTNEGRLSSLFPGATTQSRFFTIYAYAQAGRTNPSTNQFEVDSEQVTKTLVEVEEQAPATNPPTYKVKKLYSQPINAQ